MIDLLAAVPSVVFGLWGISVLALPLQPAHTSGSTPNWLAAVLRRPRLGHRAHHPHRRPRAGDHDPADHHRDLARGVRADADPARGGCPRPGRHPLGDDPDGGLPLRQVRRMVSAVMLGLGRALGETMAVAMVLSAGGGISFNLISSSNPASIASNIASNYPQGAPGKIQVLIATGLVLFLVTFLVNFAARWIVHPRRQEARAMSVTTAPTRPLVGGRLVHPGQAARASPRSWWPSSPSPPPRCPCSSWAGASSRGAIVAGVVFLVALPALGPHGRRAARRGRPRGHGARLGGPGRRPRPARVAALDRRRARRARHQADLPDLLDVPHRPRPGGWASTTR